MAFHDVRLPEDVERGAVGGPEFNTTIVQTVGGHEQRIINWSEQRGSWMIGYGIEYKTDLQDMINFFYARRGRAHGFRFKDWSDFEIGSAKQAIGIGDNVETVFPIYKTYSSGGQDYFRPITKPVSGTVTVWKDAVIQTVGFTIDYATGEITFSAPVAAGVVVYVTCEFDVPVRFDTDKLDISMATFEAGEIPQIPIVELRI